MSVFDAFQALIALSDLPMERVVEPNTVAAKPVMPYATLAATDADTGTRRGDGSHGTETHRGVVQVVGRTAEGVSDVTTRIRDAFLNQRPTMTGYVCGPCLLEVAGPMLRDPDDHGVLTLTTTFVFTTTKENP